MSNTALWEVVCTTDPRYTKEFSRSGGFKGTAINPTYQLMKATEVFGPVGMGWGWRIEKEDYVPGCEGEVNHVIRIVVWYRITPKFVERMPEAEPFLWQVCEVTHFGQTIFVGKNKFGPFTDEEAPKKSITDAISKALSCLGFSADIHIGLYDSNKYVNDRRAEFGGDKTASPTKPQPQEARTVKSIQWSPEVEADVRKDVAAMNDPALIRAYFIDMRTQANLRDPANVAGLTALTAICNGRVEELKKAAQEAPAAV